MCSTCAGRAHHAGQDRRSSSVSVYSGPIGFRSNVNEYVQHIRYAYASKVGQAEAELGIGSHTEPGVGSQAEPGVGSWLSEPPRSAGAVYVGSDDLVAEVKNGLIDFDRSATPELTRGNRKSQNQEFAGQLASKVNSNYRSRSQ